MESKYKSRIRKINIKKWFYDKGWGGFPPQLLSNGTRIIDFGYDKVQVSKEPMKS